MRAGGGEGITLRLWDFRCVNSLWNKSKSYVFAFTSFIWFRIEREAGQSISLACLLRRLLDAALDNESTEIWKFSVRSLFVSSSSKLWGPVELKLNFASESGDEEAGGWSERANLIIVSEAYELQIFLLRFNRYAEWSFGRIIFGTGEHVWPIWGASRIRRKSLSWEFNKAL